MRILFVAMSESIHTARWINQLQGQGWDLHLFPSLDFGATHPDLRQVTVHHSFYSRRPESGATAVDRTVKRRGIPVLWPCPYHAAFAARVGMDMVRPDRRAAQLRGLVKKLRPDIIHSMEIQGAGYLTLAARRGIEDRFPPWIVTNWGSDIYLFGRLAAHTERIKAVLSACTHYSCECQRDVDLAREYGFRGEVLPVLPNTGGFNLARVAQLRGDVPPSQRRLILLKGYQGWAGRALVALHAVELCARDLQGYEVGIYEGMKGPGIPGVARVDEVRIAAELVSRSTGIPIQVISHCTHEEMLAWYGKARAYVGLSISDAIPTSLLESMVTGAFPIQSNTGAAEEWVIDGESGIIVPPEDPGAVAAAIRRAVSDDALVDRAAEINARVAREKLDEMLIRPRVVTMYQRIAARGATQ